jgi:hypothetical protein
LILYLYCARPFYILFLSTHVFPESSGSQSQLVKLRNSVPRHSTSLFAHSDKSVIGEILIRLKISHSYGTVRRNLLDCITRTVSDHNNASVTNVYAGCFHSLREPNTVFSTFSETQLTHTLLWDPLSHLGIFAGTICIVHADMVLAIDVAIEKQALEETAAVRAAHGSA